MVMSAPASMAADGKITTRYGGISIGKTPGLDPIYNATGPIYISNVPAGLRNVIGVLKGSDPVLKDTYVFVTAHYDHIGEKKGFLAGFNPPKPPCIH